jgi:hypothetical protein
MNVEVGRMLMLCWYINIVIIGTALENSKEKAIKKLKKIL